jgi:hypothetical protein
MRVPVRCLCAIGLVAMVTSQGTAQDVGHLGPRVRVRVWTPLNEPQVGTLIDLRRDTLLLETEEADTVHIARAAVTRFEVSQGRRSHVGQGVLIGAVAAGATGYLLGKGLDHTSVCTSGCEWAVAAPFAAGGAVLGALVGALARTEHWQDVSADRFRLSVAPRYRGIGLVASARF